METINVSTYELLVKPIIDTTQAPNRTVIQGYFLSIANPQLSDLEIELTFRAATPDFTSSSFVAFWDVGGINVEVVPVPDPPITTASYRFNLPPLDTGLFLLLPNVTEEEIISDSNTEIRGYVRLSIPSATPVIGGSDERTLLLSAQQRGTFLPQGATVPPQVGDYDQFSYSLPTATGGSEATVEANVVAEISLPVRKIILNAIDNNPGLISQVSSGSFAEMLSGLDADQQRQMLKLFLERFEVREEALSSR